MKSSKLPLVLRWLLPAQLLLIPGLVQAQTAAPAPAAAEPPKEEVLVLSPFQVVADNRG